MSKNITEILSQMKVFIVSSETNEEHFEDVLATEGFEEDPDKFIFEFDVQDDATEYWAHKRSGYCAYCATLDEAVVAFNEAVESGIETEGVQEEEG